MIADVSVIEGKYIVINHSYKEISMHDITGQLLYRTTTDQIAEPTGVQALQNGKCIVLDSCNNKVLLLSPDGVVAETILSGNRGNNVTSRPHGVFYDELNHLLIIVELLTSRVKLFRY